MFLAGEGVEEVAEVCDMDMPLYLWVVLVGCAEAHGGKCSARDDGKSGVSRGVVQVLH